MRPAVLWGMIGLGILALTACAAPQQPQPSPTPPQVVLSPSPVPTRPPSTSTPTGLPNGVVLQFIVQGGLAGFCEELKVTGTGNMTLASCRFPEVSARLTPDEYAQLEALVRPYRPYQGGHRAAPDVTDDMTLWVEVHGIGTEEAPEAVIQQALDFAQQLASRLREAARAQLPPVPPLTTYREMARTNPERALEVLAADLEAYLLQVPGGASSLREANTHAALVEALRLEGSPFEPTVIVEDADGDGRDDLVVGPGAMGVPALALLTRESGYKSVPVPAPDAIPADLRPSAWARVHRADDINGDGRPEVVVEYVVAGASATTQVTFVAQWAEGHFVPLLTLYVSDWGGPASWELLSDGRIQQVCPAFGLFDHKLLPHPSQRRTYAWDSQAGRYVLEAVEETPPQTVRQQVNVAEALLQQGRYEPALEAYRQAVENTSLQQEEDVKFDLRAWSLLRQAQILFAWDEPTARDLLQQAAGGKGLAGEIAGRLSAAFESPDPLAPALVWLTPETLRQLTGHPEAWILTNSYEALAPQLSLSAVVNRQPDLLALGNTDLTTFLQDAGLPVARALIANLDNDPAAPELLIELELPLSPVESYRFVVLMDQRAEARGFGGVIVAHGGLTGLEGLVESTPPVVQVRDERGRLRRFTWDGNRLLPAGETTNGTNAWNLCRVGVRP